MRSRENMSGEKGQAGDMGMMQPVASKDDYKIAIKQVKKLQVVSDDVLKAVEAMVDVMEDGQEGAMEGFQGESQDGPETKDSNIGVPKEPPGRASKGP